MTKIVTDQDVLVGDKEGGILYTPETAAASVKDRNERAEKLGIKARYKVAD